MKFIYIIIFSFSSFLLFAQNTPIDSIPFKLEKDNRIYSYLKVNNTDSLYFLIDTGASDMVISSRNKSKAKIEINSSTQNKGTTGVNKVGMSTNNVVQWGNQRIDNLNFLSIPYPNEKWDGVLGLSLMRKYTVKIDYDAMLIYLYDKKTYQNKNPNGLKIKYKHQVPFVDVCIKTIDDKTHNLSLEIDTGSDRIIDISTSYVNKKKLLDVYKSSFANSTVTSSDGNSGTIFNVYFSKVKISNFELYKIPGGVAQIQFGLMNMIDIDGMIGNWFLKRFNLTLDFQNDYLYLEPNNYIYTPFYEFLTK